jgi:hypothetical protein
MCLVPLSAFPAADLAAGRLTSAESGKLPVPSSRATTKRPTRMIIGVVVFAVGVLAGALIAAWVVPPA